jgi:alpha-galactosidase
VAGSVHTDWAAPTLICGTPSPDGVVLPLEKTLFSFESGTEDFTIANVADGGTSVQSPVFHTNGEQGLLVTTPASGNWFGRTFAEPLDLTGTSMLKFDIKTAAAGTSAEIAVHMGADSAWCSGGLWTWTNPNSTNTITEKFSDISCPEGVTFDPTQIRGIWLFVNGTEVYIDNVRAE